MFSFLREPDKPVGLYEQSHVAFIFSFQYGSLGIPLVIDLFDEIRQLTGLYFPDHLTHGKFDRSATGPVTEQCEFIFKGTKERASAGNPFHWCCPPATIWLSLAPGNAQQFLEAGLHEKALRHPGFHSLYAVNNEYWSVQQSGQEDVYIRNGISRKELVFKKELFGGQKEIEVIKNPGYAAVIKQSWLMAGWKMWFRNSFIDPVIGKNIARVSHYHALSAPLDGITSIQLYERQDQPHYAASKKRQHLFKQWINFEEVVKNDLTG